MHIYNKDTKKMEKQELNVEIKKLEEGDTCNEMPICPTYINKIRNGNGHYFFVFILFMACINFLLIICYKTVTDQDKYILVTDF